MSPELLLLTNAAAGSFGEGIDAALAVLREGADVRVQACDDPGKLPSLLAGSDGRRIVVAGGDGTMHNVLQALANTDGLSADTPLALLPMGTGNDLAGALGIPLDPEQAARTALHGRTRALDLAVDEDGDVLANVAHVGVGAEAARRAAALKGALGAAAYPVGATAAGVTSTGWELAVEVDGVTLSGAGDRVLMVAVANGRRVGGGTPVAPGAEPDDGLLDVMVCFATGPVERVSFATDLKHGTHVDRDDVRLARGRRVTISGEQFRANVDGEVLGPYRDRVWTVRPRAWSLLVPARGQDEGSRRLRN